MLKVTLEAQHACTPTPRGISNYSMQLIRKLLHRNKFDYGLTFFDGNKEMNNRQWIDKYFSEFAFRLYECNDLDYRVAKSSKTAFDIRSYNDFTGAYDDVFHFMSLFSIPDNLDGKMIVTIHDMTPMKYPELCDPTLITAFRIGMERLKKTKPIVITDSIASKLDILHYTDIPEKNVKVIYLSYDEEYVECNYSKNLSGSFNIMSPYILYLGAIAKHKNIERLIQAFEYINNSIPWVKLVVVGNPDQNAESVVNRITQSHLYGSNILYLGYVTDEDKHALYSNALAFVFPSLYEGFGMPVLEAMARGCPVITSKTSSLPEIVDDAAILVDPYDVEDISSSILSVVNSESLRTTLINKGLKQSSKFSWDKTAEETEKVYISAVDGCSEFCS
ncbi:MAG: glycosyltransferase family 4 protein [Oscillospiraceae bacterium]|nr:glycosyltransferase family 4 protein [Oscillospiraceae bacterium]